MVVSFSEQLPVAVIGAGPIGLAAAAELVTRDQDVLVFEQGGHPAAAVRSWGHVRLFSPWSELTSPAAVALLEPAGWSAPNGKRYPTGNDWVETYLAPLAEVLGDRVRTNSRVIGVSRLDRDLLVESGREQQPFVLHVQGTDGAIERVVARAVIDATGTLNRPNPLGSEGYPVAGETEHADRILYGMPNPDAAGNPCAWRVHGVGSQGDQRSQRRSTGAEDRNDKSGRKPVTHTTWSRPSTRRPSEPTSATRPSPASSTAAVRNPVTTSMRPSSTA